MSADDEIPKYYATRKYKDWVLKKLEEKGWTYGQFANEVKRRGMPATAQGLQQFLNKGGSNTTLMPAINRALGLPPPSHFDPTSSTSKLHATIDANWDRVPEEVQQAWVTLLASYGQQSK